jgi:hypothetical protein
MEVVQLQGVNAAVRLRVILIMQQKYMMALQLV